MTPEKAEMRKEMGRLRAALPLGERTRLAAMVERHLLGLREVAEAVTVLVFYAFGSEVATSGLILRLGEEGKRVLLPYLVDGEMEAAEALPGEALLPTTYGPHEPARQEPVPAEEVEVAIAPGLAFDASGHRLGYGGGHYDRYLRRMRPEAPRIGIGFAFQVVERVPAVAHDERLDLVVTEEGALRSGRHHPPV
ncbi:MAG TPA: 5-formyltetrahydrofolate cyclo-ligase [Actinomycetota bacterium]